MKILYALSDFVITLVYYAWALLMIAIKGILAYTAIYCFEIKMPGILFVIIPTAAFCIRDLKRAQRRSRR